MQDKKFTERLKQRLAIEFQNQDRSGAYGALHSAAWLTTPIRLREAR